MRLTVTLLGTGTSTGLPVIGCGCRVCTSTDPRDARTRCAAHVVAHAPAGDVHLQIDMGPDFRHQALREGLHHVDAVLVTHHHFDHVVGMDDLRPFFFANRATIPVYAAQETATVLRRMFGYIFEDGSYPGVSRLELREVGGAFSVGSRATEADVEVVPIPALHGSLPVLGYRVGRFAYLTDVSAVPPESRALLGGLDVLVLDALRHEPHLTHFSIEEAVGMAQALGARQTYFVHMTHSVLHAEEGARLRDHYGPGVALGYDGLTFEVAG
jgi:phosphoribosyl 1,2-cyclic phosphate phosphodiesterase